MLSWPMGGDSSGGEMCYVANAATFTHTLTEAGNLTFYRIFKRMFVFRSVDKKKKIHSSPNRHADSSRARVEGRRESRV